MRKATSVAVSARPSPSFALQQRFQADVDRTPQPLQSQLREHAILAQQGDCIGDGGDGHNFHERHQQARLIFCIQPALHQSLRQLKATPAPHKCLQG